MKKLPGVLCQLMNEQALTVSELARRTGVPQPVMYKMLHGQTDNPKIKTLTPIADYFSITLDQLLGRVPLSKREKANWKVLPILSWRDVLHWEKAIQQACEEKTVTAKPVSDNAYAIKIVDTSMLPLFPLDTVLIIEPQLTPKDRDYALIHLEGDKLPLFKQVLYDGQDVYLKPLNPEFKMIYLDKPYQWLGVMVQAQLNYT